MSQVMSHFLPTTAILPRKRGSQPELSHIKRTGTQPKHHFRNPMLYPFELRAPCEVNHSRQVLSRPPDLFSSSLSFSSEFYCTTIAQFTAASPPPFLLV